MPRTFTGDTLVIASHNHGKVREIGDLLAPFVAHCAAASEFGLDDPEETGGSFAANAELKARYVAERTGKPALADDSGLVVPALGGAPGIHTARWAELPGGRRDFYRAMERLNECIMEAGRDGAVDRTAYFVCALALAWADGDCETVEGRVDGTLTWPPRGKRGFGYDPVFVPDGYVLTFGEMDPVEKHRISHRANAFRQLVERCFTS